MCYCTYTVIDIPGFYMVLYLLFQGFSLPWIKPVNSTEVPHPSLIRPGSGWVVTQKIFLICMFVIMYLYVLHGNKTYSLSFIVIVNSMELEIIILNVSVLWDYSDYSIISMKIMCYQIKCQQSKRSMEFHGTCSCMVLQHHSPMELKGYHFTWHRVPWNSVEFWDCNFN